MHVPFDQLKTQYRDPNTDHHWEDGSAFEQIIVFITLSFNNLYNLSIYAVRSIRR